MKCAKCNVSADEKPFLRINEFGVDGIWWCEDCVKLHEPELYANLKEDESEVEGLLKDWFYPNRK